MNTVQIIQKRIEPRSIEEGSFYDENYFTTRIKKNTDYYVNGQLLFCFRKRVIDNKKWFPIAETHLKKPILTSNNRRMAGDDPRKRVNSAILGFFDRLTPQMKHRLKLPKAGRPTAFIKKYPYAWKLMKPLFEQLDAWYNMTSPLFYDIQKKAIRQVVPALRISGTVFTTVTVNRNWRTATHTDKGDFKNALSCIAFLGKNISGGFFGFPQYGILIEAKPGDAILMNPHEAHCNTELNVGENGTRFSFVCYLREDLCGMTQPVAMGGGQTGEDDIVYVHPPLPSEI